MQSFLKPTGQLMSIHAFVEKDGRSMQFPLLFALMSRRRKEDNTEVKYWVIIFLYMKTYLYNFLYVIITTWLFDKLKILLLFQVFRAVQNRFGNSSVEMVTADFEAGILNTCKKNNLQKYLFNRSTYRNINVFQCCFSPYYWHIFKICLNHFRCMAGHPRSFPACILEGLRLSLVKGCVEPCSTAWPGHHL